MTGSKDARILLTIRAMVDMGPWLLRDVDELEGRHEKCEVCGTRIKHVWVMEKQTAPRDVKRIGSECGPRLELMSATVWNEKTKQMRGSIRQLAALAKLDSCERAHPELRPKRYPLGWAAEQRCRVGAG